MSDDRVCGSHKVKVTLLASEWGSSKGGLSTINRELAIQLAKCPEVEITFFLPQCSQEDRKVALQNNVKIVEATPLLGYEQLEWLSFPPDHLQIDIIVGHGVKLGKQVQIIKKSKKCKWLQVVHTDPEELGMFKNYSNPISKGEEKFKTEVELCKLADHVVGVGPKLSEAFRSYLRSCRKDDTVLDFTPGTFEEFAAVKQAPSERQQRSVLVFGRGDVEDFELKGFDIAGKAIAALEDTRLVFVGAPYGKHEEIAKRLIECGVPERRLRVRGFVKERESLKDLFQEVDLVIMPSRTEGFGLTGLEALSAGLPVLVSSNSGFGEALCSVPFGSKNVVNSDKPTDWTSAIKKIWAKDRKSRLEEAKMLRDSFDKKYNWARQIKDLIEKMISWVHDDSSNHQRYSETKCSKFSQCMEGTTEDIEAENILPSLQNLQCDADQVRNKTILPSNLRTVAAKKGFLVSDNQSSGNCLFYALSEQLKSVKGIQISHKELRNTLVQFLRENANLHDGTSLFNFVSGYPSWREYLQSMAKDGTWGDHVVLFAAANHFQTAIRIISSLDREIVVHPEHAVAAPTPLVLGHIHELHYVSLQPRKDECLFLRNKRNSEGFMMENNEIRLKRRRTMEDLKAFRSTDFSYPSDILEKIRQLYRTREQRLLPVPWCEDFSFHLNDMFTRLKIVGKEKSRGVLTDKITNMTAIFKAHAECQSPRTVLIEGDPGMGKTTYCQKLAYDWATKHDGWDPSFPEIEVLLLLKCNEIQSNIWEAVDDQILPEEMEDQAKECFFKFIRENQSKVLLVLDGLDEVDPSNLKVLSNLIQGKELSGCYIVVTSRHEAGSKVRRYCDTLWEIEGFTKKDAESFILKYFKNINKEHLAWKLLKSIWDGPFLFESQQDRDLSELTKNPLNTALLCVICEDFEGVFPTNRTELYTEIVLCVLRRYEQKQGLASKNEDLMTVYKKELIDLGRMALESLRNGELYFEENKSNGGLIVLSKFGFLSLQAGGSKRKVVVRYAFLHKSFQEFFSGFYLAYKLIEGEIECEAVVTDQRYENELYQVFLFTIGILVSTSEKTAKSLVTYMARNITSLQSAREISKRLAFSLGCLSKHESLVCTLGKHLHISYLKLDTAIWRYEVVSLFKALSVNSSLTNLDLSKNSIGDSGAASLSQAVAVNSSLTNLDLMDNFIGPSGAASLSQALAVNSSLTNLVLLGNSIGDSGVASLSQALAVNSTLTNFDLGWNSIGDSGAASLSQALAVNSSLTNLNLSRNRIDGSGAASLSQALAVNSSLTNLDLNGNSIGDSGAATLSQALAVNSCLTNLNLSLNSIGASGAASLSQALAVNSSLTNLDLSGNSIGDSGAASLSQALVVNSSLTNLDLSGNSIGDSGAASLSQALVVNSSLTNLYLSENSIGDSGAASLSLGLGVNSSLTNLYLSENRIGASGAASLSQALGVNSSLTNLDLSENSIGEFGAASLSQALAVNSSLTNLDLSGNGIGDSGAASLSQALAVNFSLTTLDLRGGSIGNSGAAFLSQALAVNSSLTNLNLHLNFIGSSGAASLSQALAVNSSLTNLNLRSNSIGPSGAASLSQALIVNSSLTNLDLRGNSIGDSGAASLS
ncbi:unnamed protein product [Porites lobata]|uniref:Uncharacterized protein n=1 Tax=Porites lobata TaxID=104759 RepID=A0ABN8NFF0_9CNID|nr:unnamed protein product [Porites lobata]